jgi:hypothetical protein
MKRDLQGHKFCKKKKNKEVECLFQEGHENKNSMSTTKELLNSCYYEKNASIVRG